MKQIDAKNFLLCFGSGAFVGYIVWVTSVNENTAEFVFYLAPALGALVGGGFYFAKLRD